MNSSLSTKFCYFCGQIKNILEFPKDSSRPDGYHSKCKLCKQQYQKQYTKQWRLKNKDKIKIQKKTYNEQNLEKYKQDVKLRYQKKLLKDAQWSQKDRLKYKEYYTQYNKEYQKQRRSKDITFRILGNLRHRMNLALRQSTKTTTTIDLIGCTVEEFRNYISNLWKAGMSWENYGNKDGQWSIDHIIPCTFFDLTDPVEQKQCFHYTNCQPLWHLENIKKRNHLHDLKTFSGTEC